MITAEDKKQQEIANSITAKPIDNPETKYKLLVVNRFGGYTVCYFLLSFILCSNHCFI